MPASFLPGCQCCLPFSNDPNTRRYYLWDIEESKPLILVLEGQVHGLLQEINSHCKLELKVTNSQREEGLVLRFPDHPRCRPRYLGRSHTRDEYNSMTDQVPLVSVRAPGEPTPPSLDAQSIEDFRQMIEDAWEVTKNKSKASKEKKRVDRLKKQKIFTDQLKRAQRYLGLRPTAPDGTYPSCITPQGSEWVTVHTDFGVGLELCLLTESHRTIRTRINPSCRCGQLCTLPI